MKINYMLHQDLEIISLASNLVPSRRDLSSHNTCEIMSMANDTETDVNKPTTSKQTNHLGHCESHHEYCSQM